MAEGAADVFPYPANAIKIGELGAPGAYQPVSYTHLTLPTICSV